MKVWTYTPVVIMEPLLHLMYRVPFDTLYTYNYVHLHEVEYYHTVLPDKQKITCLAIVVTNLTLQFLLVPKPNKVWQILSTYTRKFIRKKNDFI